MGLISLIEHLAQVLTGGTASKVAADEVKAWSPWLAARLTKFAVKQLPKSDRERYAEEWDSHVADTPGSVGKICVALGFSFAAQKIRRANGAPLEIRLPIALALVLLGITQKVIPHILKVNDKYPDGSPTPWYVTLHIKICLSVTLLQLKWAIRLSRPVELGRH